MSSTIKAFVCYLDDNDKKVEGYFEIVETNSGYIKMRTGKNELTIPMTRIKKVKRSVE